MKITKIAIADDHPIVRKALKKILIREFDVEFVGEVDDGNQLLELVEQVTFDIAIIDLEMPNMDGYNAILKLHTNYPEIKTIAFSGFLNSTNQTKAINMGAFATISKADSKKVICEAIQTVIEDKSFHSNVEEDFYVQPLNNKNYVKLTLREEQILTLIAKGKTSREIGEKYKISQWTVDKHRSNIREKFGFKNLAEMIRYAIEINSPMDN